MTTYIITFDIKSDERKKEVKKILRSFDYYCPIHDNAWAVRSDGKASDIRDKLTPQTAQDDSIFVIRTGVEAAWRNSYGEKNDDWLKKHL